MSDPKKFDLSLMSWKEVEAYQASKPIVFIPVGTHEAQGPQNPVSADYLLAYHFSKRVAKASDSLYLPGIRFGNSAAFQGFYGAIWLQPETLRSLVYDVCMSVVSQGFDHIVIVNNHGPNEPAIEAALRQIRKEKGIVIPLLWPSMLAKKWVADLFEPESIGHGSEPQTSLMLHLEPDSVREDYIRHGAYKQWQGLDPISSSRARFEDQAIGLYLDVHEYSEAAVRGAPMADAHRGEELMKLLVAFGVRFADHFRGMDPKAGAQD